MTEKQFEALITYIELMIDIRKKDTITYNELTNYFDQTRKLKDLMVCNNKTGGGPVIKCNYTQPPIGGHGGGPNSDGGGGGDCTSF